MARTHVLMSDEVLKAVEAMVGKRGRSRFIEGATRERLERLALEEALEEAAGIAQGPGYEHWRDRKATREWIRRVRERPGS